MTKDDQPGSTLPRRQLGRALRDAREGAGFTLERSAQLMEMGKTSLGRIEKGQNDKVRLRDIETLGELYGLAAERVEELKALAQQMATKSWWQASRHLLFPGYNTYLGLEAGASRLSFYQPLLVPGLVQTLSYAKSIERNYLPNETPDDIQRRVDLRIRRAAILTRHRSPVTAEFIIHESVFHTVVGSPAVMAAQARHVADMGTRPNVSVRILSLSASLPPEGVGVPPYIMLDFPADSRGFTAEPPIVYTEGAIGTMFFEESDDVKRYREIHEAIKSAALEEKPSRDLLRQVARRHEQ
ncbi:helix-turn-helix domain-containing protein [Nocardia miyunensis]|uniref:helix-turn-helix domain-containing protein n=1 Tax=Nocardia miyunensis TaxID=282684 RepID=UPI000835EF60|nr:helix-turn-helix transcriptional regulator [Nocardia miyunensis]